MVGETLFGYAVGKIADAGIDIYKEWIEVKEGQKILFECFKEYVEREGDKCCTLSKEVILGVDSKKIQPNYTDSELMSNLEEIFDKCIHTDDKDYGLNIRREICTNYLMKSGKELLKLYHVNENILILNDEVLKNREICSNENMQITKGVEDLKKGRQNHYILLMN